MLTIGGARSLPGNVKMLTFGHSYGTAKEINIARQVLALPSESFFFPGRKSALLPYHKVCYPASNNRQLVSQSVSQLGSQKHFVQQELSYCEAKL